MGHSDLHSSHDTFNGCSNNEHDQHRVISNVCYIGAGYVGGLSAVVMAHENQQVNFHVVDLDEARIAAWLSDVPPVKEPGLNRILLSCRDGMNGRRRNLHFSTNVESTVSSADVLFIAVNTPPKESGYGAHQALDVSYVEACVETIARAATGHTIIVEKSTVPCGTADSIRYSLNKLARPGATFTVISNPEFLAEGTAMFNLLHPDRILIGSDQDSIGTQAAKTVGRLYESWIPTERILYMTTKSAELTKLAANALLAQRISSINAISAICERAGADVDEVARACGLDVRIGPHMLSASLGFGGSCLKKDVLTLAHFADDLDLPQVGSYWRSISEINEFQKSRFTRRIVKAMNNSLIHKKIAVLGCAFKKNTDDIRESPAVTLIADLLLERAQVSVYDPKVQRVQLSGALSKTSRLETCSDPWNKHIEMHSSIYEACDNAHAVVIATDLEELLSKAKKARSAPISEAVPDFHSRKSVDWAEIALRMRHPKLVFDGRNVVDDSELASLGMHVHMIGKRPFPASDGGASKSYHA